MDLFPLLNDSAAPAAEQMLPEAREFARDPVTGRTVWVAGSPTIVTGADAVASWAYAALATVRCRHGIYDSGYGCELEQLIGRQCSAAVKNVEAARMVRDALLVSPYVTDVRGVVVDFSGSTLTVSCVLVTIYGEVEIYG